MKSVVSEIWYTKLGGGACRDHQSAASLTIKICNI